MNRLLFYLFFGLGVIGFSNEKYLKFALENIEYRCNPTKKTIKFEGKDFIGHFDEEGKPYGEWYLKSKGSKQCFLESEEILDYKELSLYIKDTQDYTLVHGYGFVNDIYLYLKKENKSYYYEKKDNKYQFKPNVVVLTPALIRYPDMVNIFESR